MAIQFRIGRVLARAISFALLLASVVAVGCNFNYTVGGTASNGPAPRSPSATLKTSPAQAVSVGIKYFDDVEGKMVKWVAQSLVLEVPDNGELPIELEDGHDGYQIDIITASESSTTLTLFSEGKKFKSTQSKTGGVLKVVAGSSLNEYASAAQDIRLSTDQKHSLQKLVDTLFVDFENKLADLEISESNATIADRPVLKALATAVAQKLGKLKKPDFKHWVRYETEHSLLLHRGTLQFENGKAEAAIYTSEDKLYGLGLESELLGEDWFTVPNDTSLYRQRGEQMVRHMAAGRSEEAHRLLAKTYHEQIPLERLAVVSKQITDLLSSEIASIKVVSEGLGEPGTSKHTPYEILYLAKMTDGSEESFKVYFEFLTRADAKVGLLSGIYHLPKSEKLELPKANEATPTVKESDPKIGAVNPVEQRSSSEMADPKKKGNELSWQDRQRVNSLKLIQSMSAQDVDAFVGSLHPLAQKHVDPTQLAAIFKRVHNALGKLETGSWKLLESSGEDMGLTVSGRLAFENDAADVKVTYADYKPTGILIRNKVFSADTYGATTKTEALVEHAVKYWDAMFKKRPEDAYRLFIPEGFDKDFPRERFMEIYEFSELAKHPDPKQLYPGPIRISTSTEHDHAIHLEVFNLLQRVDGRYETCRLRFAIQEDDQFRLVSFDTPNFETEFPIDRFQLQAEFFKAVGAGDAEAIINQMHPFDRESVNQAVFNAFCDRVAKVLGPFEAIDTGRFSGREFYAEGKQQIDASGIVKFRNTELNCSTTHVYDLLEGFNFSRIGEGFLGWEANIKDTTPLERRGEKMLRELITGDVAKALRMLPKDFHDEIAGQIEDVKTQRTEFIELTGELKSLEFASKEFDAEKNWWTFHYDLEFENDTGTGLIAYEFDAFNGLITSFNYKRDRPKEESEPEESEPEESEPEESESEESE